MEPNPTTQPNTPPQSETQPSTVNEPTHKPVSRLPLLLLILLLAVVTIAAGYFFLQNQSLKSQLGLPGFKPPWIKVTCEFNSQTYQPGDPVPSGDSCNTCTCTDTGQVACTLMACAEDVDQTQADPTANWQVYTNNNLGISFKYPINLAIQESEENGFYNFYQKESSMDNPVMSMDIRMIGPLANYEDAVQESLADKTQEIISQENLNNGIHINSLIKSGIGEGMSVNQAYFRYKDAAIKLEAPNNLIEENIFNQILSTFEFSDNSES